MKYNAYMYMTPELLQISQMFQFFHSPHFMAYAYKAPERTVREYYTETMMNSLADAYKRSDVDLNEWCMSGAYLNDLLHAYKHDGVTWCWLCRYKFTSLFSGIHKLDNGMWIECPIECSNQFKMAEIAGQHSHDRYWVYYKFKLGSPIMKVILKEIVNDLYNAYYPKDPEYKVSNFHKGIMDSMKYYSRYTDCPILDDRTAWVMAFFRDENIDILPKNIRYKLVLERIFSLLV